MSAPEVLHFVLVGLSGASDLAERICRVIRNHTRLSGMLSIQALASRTPAFRAALMRLRVPASIFFCEIGLQNLQGTVA